MKSLVPGIQAHSTAGSLEVRIKVKNLNTNKSGQSKAKIPTPRVTTSHYMSEVFYTPVYAFKLIAVGTMNQSMAPAQVAPR